MLPVRGTSAYLLAYNKISFLSDSIPISSCNVLQDTVYVIILSKLFKKYICYCNVFLLELVIPNTVNNYLCWMKIIL